MLSVIYEVAFGKFGDSAKERQMNLSLAS